MRINARRLHLVVAMVVAQGVGDPVFAQPVHPQSRFPVNPVTGLPNGTNFGPLNPVTGLPRDDGGALPAAERLRQQAERERVTRLAGETATSEPEVSALEPARALTQAGRYAEALKRFLALYDQARASQDSLLLGTALPDWMDLGEKYPEARQALVDIRDKDTGELMQGRGDLSLFEGVVGINAALAEDASTAALFKSLRHNHPSEAEAWYLYAEPSLVRCGEYQLCLDCIGNPETRFDIYCRTLKMAYGTAESAAERSRAWRRRALEIPPRPGRPPGAPFVSQASPAEDIALAAITNSFTGEVSNLVAILVQTGHGEEAEKIRGEAATILAGLHPLSKASGEPTPAAGPLGADAGWPPRAPWTTPDAGSNSGLLQITDFTEHP